MTTSKDHFKIKFLLSDSSEIGPIWFVSTTRIATLKETILAQWPKDKEDGPTTIHEVKLISAGKILENKRTLAECQNPLCDFHGGVTTMHVMLLSPTMKKDKRVGSGSRKGSCTCVIL